MNIQAILKRTLQSTFVVLSSAVSFVIISLILAILFFQDTLGLHHIRQNPRFIIAFFISALLLIVCLALALLWWCRRKHKGGDEIGKALLWWCRLRDKGGDKIRKALLWWCRLRDKGGDKIFIDDEVLRNLSGHPRMFSYKELDTATNSFATKIGRGGYGTVFLGTLKDRRKVAVKQLNNTEEEGREDFIAEVRTLAYINHSNLVRLYGLCVEERYHLVYEFMDNGSLHDWLFNPSREPLDWKTRYSITVETARGLAYLHEDSTPRIFHLDVKPQNILLDENFKAKLSDFGLAKILNKDESGLVTFHARGTPGYIAPELVYEHRITAKNDVYSYGMVLLEIVGGRRVVDNSQDYEQWYLPSVAFEKARQGKLEELFDSRLSVSEEAAVEMKRVINLALWCIQSNSALRPKMSVIIQILEGGLLMMDPPLDCSLPFGPSVDNNHLLIIIEEDTQAILGKSSSMDHQQPPISPSQVVVVNVT